MEKKDHTKLADSEEVEKRMQLLHQIVSQTDSDLDAQLQKALELTTTLLEMEIGIISSIEKDTYTVSYFYPDDSGLSRGQTFELGNTYCSITVEAADVITIEHMGTSPWNRHPCYGFFNLEAYIGIPVWVDNELYGTINFSSSDIKEGGFLHADEDLVRLLGDWVSSILKRRQIEQELEEKKEWYKIISSNSADMVCLHDAEGVYEFVSPSSVKLTGYTPEDLIGRNHYEFVHPDDVERLRKNPHSDLKQGESVASTEYRYKHKEGYYIWLESSANPITNTKGEVEKLQSVSRDISKRKKMEEELLESERLYKLISTNSAGMVCLHEPDGTYEFVSPSAENILGYTPEELVGKNPYDFFHPEDLERVKEESHRKALNNNPISSFQYRVRKKNGNFIWLDTATEPITDDQGEVVKLQTSTREITSQKQLEILFAQSQKMAHVGGWEYDLESGSLFWTDEVYRIHEVPVGTAVSVEDGLSFFPEEAKDKIQEAINYTIETGEKYDVELPFVTAKGSNKWVRAIGQALFTGDEAYMLRGTFQDITKQKQNEEQIKEKNAQLNKLTENRDKLYSIIAHDLKGAFYGIYGLLGIVHEELEEAGIDEDMMYNLQLARSSSENAFQLLQNLLDWIRIQQGEFEPNIRTFDIVGEVKNCASLMKPAAQNKQISIITDFEENDIKVTGDKAMVATIIRNIISNAIKFSNPENEIWATVYTRGNNVQISVKDTGIGMTEKIKMNLFNPTSRPKQRGTARESGTGLGLLLCKEMLELNNGSMEVKSEEGVGSEFIVHLPKAG